MALENSWCTCSLSWRSHWISKNYAFFLLWPKHILPYYMFDYNPIIKYLSTCYLPFNLKQSAPKVHHESFHSRSEAFFSHQRQFSESAALTEVISPWTKNKQRTVMSSRHTVDKTVDHWVSIYLQKKNFFLGVNWDIQTYSLLWVFCTDWCPREHCAIACHPCLCCCCSWAKDVMVKTHHSSLQQHAFLQPRNMNKHEGSILRKA